MMFRSKKISSVSDKPLPPTWEEMEEDLKNASRNDIVFTTINDPQISHQNSQDETDRLLALCRQMKQSSDMSQENLFLSAMKCVEINILLKDKVNEMCETKESLNELCNNLRESVEKVKIQAMGAISKS